MSRQNEQYHFDYDDLPAPMGMPAYAGGRSRIMLQINGRFSGSVYEEICFMWEREAAKEACEALNKSVYRPIFAEVIERACRYHQWRGEQGDQPAWAGPKETPKGFHWRDGLYFKRTENGSVRMTKFARGGASEEVESDVVIPPNEWASIVASVSVAGETSERWDAAQDFHGRAISSPPN